MDQRFPASQTKSKQGTLQVEHGVLEAWLGDPVIPQLLCFLHDSLFRGTPSPAPSPTCCRSVGEPVEQLSQIASPTFAGDVGVIRRGHQTHSLCRACKHVAERVGQSLDFVSLEANVVVHDVIVGRARGALQPAVRYLRF